MIRRLEVLYEAGVLRPLEPLPFEDKQRLLVTVTDEVTSAEPSNNCEREQAWLRVHGSEYAGQWLALDGDNLIAHGENGREVIEQACGQGVEEPLVVRIPKEPELPFGGW